MALWDSRKKSSRRLFSTRHLIQREPTKSSWRELRAVLVIGAVVMPIAWWVHGPPRLVFSDGTTWPAWDDATPATVDVEAAPVVAVPVAQPMAAVPVATSAFRMPSVAARDTAPSAFGTRLAELERRALAGDGKAAL